jgi:hypothetical protein
MKKLLQFLVESIVLKPKKVLIEEQKENEAGFIELIIHTHPDDLKMVIGKGGRTIKAIRELVKIKALQEKKKVQVNIQETPKK